MTRNLVAIAFFVFSFLFLHATDWHVDASRGRSDASGTYGSPFSTIGGALRKVQAGDTVTVAAGTYREGIRLWRRKFASPVVLRAAPGSRPVISGFRRVSGWRRGADGYYRARIGYKPKGLLIDGEYQPLVRLPETGWLRMRHTGGYSFAADMKEEIPVGAGCYVWIAWGNVFGTVPLKASAPGAYELEKPWFKMSRHAKSPDRCFFVNHPALIRRSGQWAWSQLDKRTYEVCLRYDGALDSAEVLVGGACIPVDVREVSNLTISGFDIVGSQQHGLSLTGSRKVTVRHVGCYWNGGAGFWLRGCDGATVEGLRLSCNTSGMSCMDNRNVVIRGCEVCYNFEDGLTVTWKSDGVLVEGNRFHHQVSWGHPDNIQMYRGVSNVTFRNNLLFCGGQGIMAEQASKITLDNNLIVGTDAISVIWGHNSCYDIRMRNNTVLFGGWGEVINSGKGFVFTDNVLMGNEFSKRAQADLAYKGAGNHFITHGDGWFGKENGRQMRTFANYLSISGEERHTRQTFPVAGMPGDMSVISGGDIAECTEGTVVLRQNSAVRFGVGDVIEVNFDGVPRRVTAIAGRSISFSPALDFKPLHAYVVLNWKGQKDMNWDPRLDCKAGSTVPFAGIREDGCTRVPLPANVGRFIRELPRLIPPHRL